jgi:hypothetical protein
MQFKKEQRQECRRFHPLYELKLTLLILWYGFPVLLFYVIKPYISLL